jgi:hypothetical protein
MLTLLWHPWLLSQHGAAVAVCQVAVRMLDGATLVHAPALGAQRNPIAIALIDALGRLLQGNGGDPADLGIVFIDVPGIKGGVSRQIGDPLGEIEEQALDQDIVVAHISALKRLGIFSQDHIPIVGGGSGHHPAAIAPQAFFAGRRRAISLLPIVAALDAETTIGIPFGLLLFVEAVGEKLAGCFL